MDQLGNDFVGCVLLASNCCFVVGVGLSTSLGIEDTASAVDVVSGVNTSVFWFLLWIRIASTGDVVNVVETPVSLPDSSSSSYLWDTVLFRRQQRWRSGVILPELTSFPGLFSSFG